MVLPIEKDIFVRDCKWFYCCFAYFKNRIFAHSPLIRYIDTKHFCGQDNFFVNMHLIFLNWLFIFFTLCGLGYWAREGLRRVFNLRFEQLHPTIHLLLGLATLIVACNLSSFFIRINLETNIAFSLIALGGFYKFRKKISSESKHWWNSINRQHSSTIIAFIFFLSIAILKTISPSEISDEGGYHLPLIRWIENYKIVPGIANIEDRMGFNPSKYMADTFFSVPYLFDGGLYELNSFLFLLFNGWFLSSYNRLICGNFQFFYSDLIASASTVFLWRVYLTSVDADYLNIFLGIAVLILLIRKIESEKLLEMDEMTLLITIFFGLLLTVKFSTIILGLPLFLIWTPLLRFNKSRMYLVKIILVAMLILIPWICRNYILSGHPIYPLYFLKMGSPDWQVLPEIAKGQFEYVQEYAKMEIVYSVNDYRVFNPSVKEWFPYWVYKNGKMLIGKVIFLGFPFGLLWVVIVGLKKSRWDKIQRLYLLQALILAATTIWFFRFPSIRLFWSGLLVFIVLSIGIVLKKQFIGNQQLLRICLFVFLFSGLIRSSISSWRELPNFALLWKPSQVQVLENYDEVEIGGVFLKVSKDNQCYGATPPCLPRDFLRGLQLRGKTVKNGFMIVR